MWENLKKIKTWVVDKVLWAERELKGKTGEEKRAVVVSKLNEIINLPWVPEWVEGKLIGFFVDMVCDKANILTDHDLTKVKTEEQKEALAGVIEAPMQMVVSAASKAQTIDDRLEELRKMYGVEREPEPKLGSGPVASAQTGGATEGAAEPLKESPQESSATENWRRSIDFSLQWEGGRNFDVVDGQPVVKGSAKADAGGATAYGITIPTLKAGRAAGVVGHSDICKLTQDEAKLIYKKNFWDRYGWGEVAWPACLCCLDISINHGGFAWILQRACVDCGQNIAVDGKYGPKTFAAAKACDAVPLAKAIVKRRKAYYENIVAKTPSQKVFLNGWLRRNNAMAKAAGV